MKLQIISPLPMQWEGRYRTIFPDAEWSTVPESGHDNYLFMWCDKATREFITNNPKQGKYNIFIRRYEYFDDLDGMDWGKVDNIIMVNDYLADGIRKSTGKQVHVVYNGVDTDKWTVPVGGPSKKVAWVGFLNQKKNIPLALQIMAELPEGYELHIAGKIQDAPSWVYLHRMAEALRLKVVYNGAIPHKFMNRWLDDKGFILSTAISEGCPNNVIEAMAKGIKPVIHNWPGAREQFGKFVFNSIPEAVQMITAIEYDRFGYRAIVERDFGLDNYRKVEQIVNG